MSFYINNLPIVSFCFILRQQKYLFNQFKSQGNIQVVVSKSWLTGHGLRFYHGHGQIIDWSQWDGLFSVMWPVLILQPQPVNHDLLTTTCGFPWRQGLALNSLKYNINASMCIKIKILGWYWHGSSFLFTFYTRKPFKMVFFPPGGTWFHSKTSIVMSY